MAEKVSAHIEYIGVFRDKTLFEVQYSDASFRSIENLKSCNATFAIGDTEYTVPNSESGTIRYFHVLNNPIEDGDKSVSIKKIVVEFTDGRPTETIEGIYANDYSFSTEPSVSKPKMPVVIQKPVIPFDDFISRTMYVTEGVDNEPLDFQMLGIKLPEQLNDSKGSFVINIVNGTKKASIYYGAFNTTQVNPRTMDPAINENNIFHDFNPRDTAEFESGEYDLEMELSYYTGTVWGLTLAQTKEPIGKINLIKIPASDVIDIQGNQIYVDKVPLHDLNSGSYNVQLKTSIPAIENATEKKLFLNSGQVYVFDQRTSIDDLTGFSKKFYIPYDKNASEWDNSEPYFMSIKTNIYDTAYIVADGKIYKVSNYTPESTYRVGIYTSPITNVLTTNTPEINKSLIFKSDVEAGTRGSPTSIIEYSLYKNGVLIKGPQRYSEFEIKDASAIDNGTYKTVVRVKGINSNSTFVDTNSNEVVIDLPTQVEVTAEVNTIPLTNIGDTIKLTGVITISPDTMTDVKWVHNDVELASLGKTLNPELNIPAVTESDLGSYKLRVFYKEGVDDTHFDSNEKILTLDELLPLDVTVTVTGPASVEEGSTTTLTGNVTIKDEPADAIKIYQWHHGKNGGIPGQNGTTLTLNNVDYIQDSGIYWMSVKVEAQGYRPAVQRSNTFDLKILRDPELVIIASVDKSIISPGESVELSFTTESLFEVSYDFAWYNSLGLIAGSENKNPFILAVEQDSEFYVKATPTSANRVITTPVTSNIVKVKVEVPIQLTSINISGLSEAPLNSPVTFTSNLLPAGQEDKVIYEWKRDGLIIDTSKDYSFTVLDYKAGNYTVKATSKTDPLNTVTSSPHIFKVQDEEIPESNGVRYIHDLRPGRDRGYIWIGWWVHDEINDALIEGFDWRKDPENIRFKYKEDLKTLAYGLEKWPDLEMQESRNGYILVKRDVTE